MLHLHYRVSHPTSVVFNFSIAYNSKTVGIEPSESVCIAKIRFNSEGGIDFEGPWRDLGAGNQINSKGRIRKNLGGNPNITGGNWLILSARSTSAS